MNKIFMIGNLTRDPETRTSAAGNQICRFGLAVNRRRKQQENQPEADFFNCTCAGKMAELAQRYLQKGRKISVVGSLTLSQYDAQDGSKRTSADVWIDDLEFLPNASQQGEGGYQPQSSGQAAGGYYGQTPARPAEPQRQNAPASYSGFSEVDEDELPF